MVFPGSSRRDPDRGKGFGTGSGRTRAAPQWMFSSGLSPARLTVLPSARSCHESGSRRLCPGGRDDPHQCRSGALAVALVVAADGPGRSEHASGQRDGVLSRGPGVQAPRHPGRPPVSVTKGMARQGRAGGWLLPGMLAMLLAGCGDGLEVRSQASVEGLDTFVVAAAEEGPGRSWDGVVKAVRQATLSAQTAGRVVEVYRDIHDRVAEGEPLLQITDVEQQSAVALARAEQAAAEATLAEAESCHRLLVDLAAHGPVSRAQLDTVRAYHDEARIVRATYRNRVI